MSLFYCTDIVNDTITLEGEEYNHAIKVLRHQIGHQLQVVDGKGNLYLAQISSITKKHLKAAVKDVQHKTKTSKCQLSIAISPLKNVSRLEWFVEKATEIGLNECHFFLAQRTEKKNVNMERMQKIMISALKQSHQYHLPKITFHTSLKELIGNTQHYNNKFLAYCENKPVQHLAHCKIQGSSILYIGPEGDFSPVEIELINQQNITLVSLGENRLRTETAALFGLITMHNQHIVYP